jgi:hypothetical protein
VIAAGLGQKAAELTSDPGLKALAGVFAIEVGKGWGELDKQEQKARELLGKAPGAAAPLAYLGVVQYLRASYEPDVGRKVDLLTQADSHLRQATESAERPGGETALRTVVYRDLAVANIHAANWINSSDPGEARKRLEAAFGYAEKLVGVAGDDPWALDIVGSVREDQAWLVTTYPDADRKRFYRESAAALKKAIEGKGDYGLVRLHAKMHLGRCRYKWANDFPDDREPERLLENAEANLDEVARQDDRTDEAEADRAEARYWLAMVELTRADLPWGKGARNGYPRDLLNPALLTPGPRLKDEHLKKAKEHLDELAQSETRSWFRDQGPEWLACLACYRAAAANKPADPARLPTRAEALGAFRTLAKQAPLTAGRLRSEFLLSQLESAKGWAKPDELQQLWDAFREGLPDPTPIPKSLQEERDLLALCVCHYKARALRIPALKLPAAGDGAKALEGILAVGKRGVLDKAELLAQLEALAEGLAAQASVAESDAPRIAPLAAGAFVAAADLDPTHGFVNKEPWKPKDAAQWRAYAARAIEKESPRQADKLYEQAETILGNQPKPDQAALDAIKKRRAALPKQ